MQRLEANVTRGLGCSTSGDELLGIAQTFRAAVRGGLVGRTRTASGVQFRVREAPEVVGALQEFVHREKACCPFFDFDISSMGAEVRLDIEGPPEARPLLDLLFQLAEPGAPAGPRARSPQAPRTE